MVTFVFKTFVLFIFEWPLKTGFTVCDKYQIETVFIVDVYCFYVNCDLL